MDADRFDGLVRAIDRRTPRRAAFGVLGGGLAALLTRLGLDDAEAKNNKKNKKKKKCKGNTIKCGKTCIQPHGCCGDAACPADQHCCTGTCAECCVDSQCDSGDICAAGACVLGQGTCPTGADACTGEPISCNEGPLQCFCFRSVTGETRCGRSASEHVCCSDDRQCAPLGLGAFCRAGGEICAGACPNGRSCLEPCPL